MKVGRHFRLAPALKIIVARDESENNFLSRFVDSKWQFEVPDTGSPITLVEGDPDPEMRRLIAAITARYSDRRSEALVEVSGRRTGHEERLIVPSGGRSSPGGLPHLNEGWYNPLSMGR